MSPPISRHCPHCGTINRIPLNHLADQGRCGSCKQGLPPFDRPIEADRGVFDDVLLSTKVPVLIDFWAPWCAPCKAAAPEIGALASEMAGRAVVLKVDAEAHPELAARFQVQAIPNFVVVRDGRVSMQKTGVSTRAEMRRWLEAA